MEHTQLPFTKFQLRSNQLKYARAWFVRADGYTELFKGMVQGRSLVMQLERAGIAESRLAPLKSTIATLESQMADLEMEVITKLELD